MVSGRKDPLVTQAEVRAVSLCVPGWRQYQLKLHQGRRPQMLEVLGWLSHPQGGDFYLRSVLGNVVQGSDLGYQR